MDFRASSSLRVLPEPTSGREIITDDDDDDDDDDVDDAEAETDASLTLKMVSSERSGWASTSSSHGNEKS